MELSEQLVPLATTTYDKVSKPHQGEVKMGLPVQLLYRFSNSGDHMLLDGLTLSDFLKNLFLLQGCG